MSKTIFYTGRRNNFRNQNNGYSKIFHWKEDKYRLDRCAAELLCRTYLERKNFDITTRILSIAPSELAQKLDEYRPAAIQENFNEILEEIKKYIQENNIEQVTIEIEEADEISFAERKAIADSTVEREKFMKRLFFILDKIHSAGVVHRDIKIENLVFVTRNGERMLVLNDWDAGFLLQGDLPDGLRKVLPIGTITYIAPEQLNSGKIGTHTDIWQAGILMYRLYNGLQCPEQYQMIDFEQGSDESVRTGLNAVWESMNSGNYTFTCPSEGSENVQKIILGALSLHAENRPKARDILNMLDNADAPQLRNLPVIRPINRADCDRIIQTRLKEKQTEVLKKRIATVVAAVIVIALFIMPKSQSENSDEIFAKLPDDTKATMIVEVVATTAYTQPITEPVRSTTVYTQPTTEPTQSTTAYTQSAGEKDYTYVKWVEDCRIGNGYYTGGLDEENQAHGRNCTYIQDNSNEYYGDFYHGKRDGKGTQITAMGTYEGEWENDKMNGKGTYTYKNGNVYTGEFLNDMRNGSGVLTLVVSENGYQGTYNGNFYQNKFEGLGTFKFDNGNTFSGEFKEDTLWNGTAIYANGLVKTIEHGKPID